MKKRGTPFPIPAALAADFDRAVVLRRERAFEAARAILASLLERAPEHPRILNEIGNTYYQDGDFAAAEVFYRRALAADPGNEAAYSNLCLLCAKTGRDDEAAEYASRILAAKPEAALTWYTLGIVYAWRRDWPRALEYSLIAVAMDDGYADAHFNCACAYAQLRNSRDALTHLSRGLADVNLLRLAEKDADLDPLRGMAEFERILARARERLGGGG